MANDNIPDPNNVPGAVHGLPANDNGYREDPPRADQASVGADRDGTDEAEGVNPLRPEERQENFDNESL